MASTKQVTRKARGRSYAYWAVRFHDPGTGTERIRYFKQRTDAKRFEAEVTQKLDQGTFHSRAHKATVAEIASRWRDTHLPRVRATTAESYRGALDNFILPRWGWVRLIDVKVAAVESWRDQLAASKGPSTIRNCLQVFGMLLKYAARDDLIERNAVALVKKPATKSKRDCLSAEQVRHLLAVLDAMVEGPVWPRRVRLFVTLAAYCGLREGEIFGLRWSDVDLKEGLATIAQQYTHGEFGEVKTDAAKRVVGLDRDVVAALRTWKLRQGGGGPHDLVLPSSSGGPMSASNFLNREYRRALKEAELPAVTAHSLRHSFAGVLKSKGVPPAVAHEIIGHSNYATTVRLYGSVSAEARLSAANTVGDAFRNGMDKQRTNA